MASFQKGANGPARGRKARSHTSGRNSSVEEKEYKRIQRIEQAPQKLAAVRVPPVRNRNQYIYYDGKDAVHGVRREIEKRGELLYDIELVDGTHKRVTFDELLALDNGAAAFHTFQQNDDGIASPGNADTDMRDSRLRRQVTKPKNDGFISVQGLDLSSDDEVSSRPPRQKRLSNLKGLDRSSGRSSRATRRSTTRDSSSSESDASNTKRRRRRKLVSKPTRRSGQSHAAARAYDEDEEGDDDEHDDSDDSSIDILQSHLASHKRKRGRPSKAPRPEKILRIGMRQSGRATRAQNNMEEANIDDIYRSDSDEPKAATVKIVNAKETFETLPRNNLFRSRHVEGCEVCSNGPNVAPLIYCQGCSLAYHKNCIGTRSTREHLVTKISDDVYVLQCRRCINVYKMKDRTAPDLAVCTDCRHAGPACKPFRHRKTTVQEQKDRDENDGLDPVTDVPSNLINNASNVMFRCTRCSRSWHYHHLPALTPYSSDLARDEDETADERFAEYSKSWMCKECNDTIERKVGGFVAWRPSDVETYHPGTPCEEVNEDEKQYLIKWDGESYFQATWFSGAWTWGVTAAAMRKAFFKREEGPKMRTEDAIPEEYLRIDIVLDIKFTSYVEVRSEEIDKARIKEVDKALIKYKGLGYEDAVWEKVPTPEDGDRWLDFVTAYNDWVAGRYIRYPKQGPLKARLEKARNGTFAKLEKQKQPGCLVGGELMKYQLEGLNWLYYQWFMKKNGILADEMGLGKTIQVIAFMATLIEEHQCFPFLVVVPNSTCANWRREIKQWVPSLRVVTYFGSSAAREMAKNHEMFPEGSKDLRAHIVVTSYETATDDSSRRVFKSVSWAGLIIDEGQRLKNDKSQLYGALTAIRAPFRLLLTGTPLQNNARELFNLLQFLDETINAAELEEKYADMTAENVRELHEQIRPYILRRTKAQVLTFLPPLGQVIIPISMSVLQKNVYKSILARNPELLKALFTTGNLKSQERANLSNILMQLRKCLCHPFVYSREIEERTDIAAMSHRNLVEASAKLQLLELLLPKLKERGHRVLIFSQFLDMLSIIEDFLDGMQMAYQRLDGTMGSLEKQKRIDQFNAPESSLFAFLLSTRAGGVGINLATADTVIILDPDFNPHQDLQAISRAHRIGQKKKVLCFQLMTRASVEEKIVQMGRKKMALDHVVVEQLGEEDIDDKDVESILKFGAAELFKDDTADHDIRYDDASIDKLLDRSQIENTKTSGDDSAESQFSFARVWANDQGTLQENLDTADDEVAPPDSGVWDKILKERRELAAAEALARAEALGRGKRTRMAVNYETEEARKAAEGSDNESLLGSAVKPDKVDKRLKKKKDQSEEDTDFQADTEDEHSEDQASANEEGQAEAADLGDDTARRRSTSAPLNQSLYKQNSAGGSQISSKSTPKSSPKKSTPKSKSNSKAKDRGTFPAITLSPGSVVKGKTGARRLSKPKPIRDEDKYGTVTVAKAPRPPPEVVDLTRGDTIRLGPLFQVPGLRPFQTNIRPPVKPFERVQMPIRSPQEAGYSVFPLITCPACHKQHPRGACELKVSGVEHCGLCGLAHYGIGRTCPHIKSETQVREMLEALKRSPEKKELVELAVKYLRGVKGTLVQGKKKEREKAMMQAGGMPPANRGPTNLDRPPAVVYDPGQAQHVQGPRPGFQAMNGAPQSYPVSRPGPGSVASHGPGQAPQVNGSSGPLRGGTLQGRWGQQGLPQDAAPIDDQHVESALLGQDN
ncbi:uncharacterized protein CC84DRAFT_1078202 [Paraphaeosphaeria sporulosa]|uniref:Chromatin remodeling complex subunit n=1 Tax=Paraphaeosphaeria sporulosa TaxID=1460663 RepID=A0A177CY78_9PLEO|nr:uncharacterized protein CC84DRAFT_1078202 [Paraphaeosphaeria sporulosa]OAG12176.1 hypothetical protein CC84DRAFT_1078202 [Paraphaeosphaeria sporulosa]